MDARGLAHRAVHLDDLARAGPLVQPVDVLGHDGPHQAALFELGEGAVPVVRLRVRERFEPACVALPDSRRIAAERVDVRDLGRVALRQMPSADRKSGIPDSVLMPAPVEHDARLPLLDQLSKTGDAHVEILNG